MTKQRLHGGTVDPVSERHRSWGAPCLATDVDMILLEYAPGGRPVALIDYKLGLERRLEDGEAKALATIADLASRAEIPGYAVKYGTEPWRFAVYPMTALSNGLYPHGRGEVVTELAYVRWLHALRGAAIAPDVARVLDDRMAA